MADAGLPPRERGHPPRARLRADPGGARRPARRRRAVGLDAPATTVYAVGDSLDLTGLTVTAEYTDGVNDEVLGVLLSSSPYVHEPRQNIDSPRPCGRPDSSFMIHGVRGRFDVDQKFMSGWSVSGVENPEPGREGTMTSNASTGSAPNAPGSASGSMTLDHRFPARWISVRL
ncbi:bacterial Ig-like domain-containing protein [Microbispora bryophytorum]|uniref:bacterial Ig-like domain-containing protein n=1 Tax=Microbispora bryophytorum TaxID=1460882 RepID=UPI0037122E8E